MCQCACTCGSLGSPAFSSRVFLQASLQLVINSNPLSSDLFNGTRNWHQEIIFLIRLYGKEPALLMCVGRGGSLFRCLSLCLCSVQSIRLIMASASLPACRIHIKHSTITHTHTHSDPFPLPPPHSSYVLLSFEIEHFCCYSFYCSVAVGFIIPLEKKNIEFPRVPRTKQSPHKSCCGFVKRYC